jgi:hypothetical protein
MGQQVDLALVCSAFVLYRVETLARMATISLFDQISNVVEQQIDERS